MLLYRESTINPKCQISTKNFASMDSTDARAPSTGTVLIYAVSVQEHAKVIPYMVFASTLEKHTYYHSSFSSWDIVQHNVTLHHSTMYSNFTNSFKRQCLATDLHMVISRLILKKLSLNTELAKLYTDPHVCQVRGGSGFASARTIYEDTIESPRVCCRKLGDGSEYPNVQCTRGILHMTLFDRIQVILTAVLITFWSTLAYLFLPEESSSKETYDAVFCAKSDKSTVERSAEITMRSKELMDHTCPPTGLCVYLFQERINFNRTDDSQTRRRRKVLIYFVLLHVPLAFGWIYYVVSWLVNNRYLTTTEIAGLSIYFWLLFAATIMVRYAFENNRLKSRERPTFHEVFTKSMRRADGWKASARGGLGLAVVFGALYMHIVILRHIRKDSNMVCQL